MLMLHGAQPPFCDRLSRRSFLAIGGLAFGGLSLTDVLRAEQRSGSAGRQRGIIMVYMPGGPPHQDMYDLKPEAPAEFRGEFAPIATSVPAIQICELLPRLASRMDRFAIIRSVVGSDGAHASTLCTTGHSYGSDPAGGWPVFGSAVSALLGPTRPAVPAVADLSERMQHDPYNIRAAGFLGTAHAPFRPEGEVLGDMVVPRDLLDRINNRKMLLTVFDRFRRAADQQRDAASLASDPRLDTCTEQALDLLTSSALVEALDLEREDPTVRKAYGTDDPQVLPYSGAGYRALMSRFLLARRLIEAGVRCVTVSFADFDWHGANFVNARKVLPLFDQGITALVDDLHARESTAEPPHDQIDDSFRRVAIAVGIAQVAPSGRLGLI